uniref:MADF domain-containing protein n=2 Tax=Acrobeloides nanus TaxID=290746 RepID=A0A914E4J5_9BILA
MTEQQNQLPDLGKLISLVRQNEILWNKAMADHNNNKWKNAAWKKIGQEWYGGASLVESARLAQTEWYRVWRKYKSEYKKLKKHIRVMPNTPFVSSFEHFDQLSFLNPIMELCVLNDGNLSIGESSIDFDGIVQYPDPIDSINAVADQAIHDFLKEETESPCFLKEETQSPANSGLNEEDEIMGPPSGSANIHITSMHMGSGQNRAMNFSFDNHLSRKRKASTDLLSGVESMLHTCANTLVDRIYEHCANSLEGIAQTHEEKVKAAVIRKSVDPEFLRTIGNLLEKDTTIQTRDRGKSYVTYPTDYVLNDTTTTTTQVEVFRAKVDRNDPIDYFKLPPDPLGPDQRPMIVRAVGPPYEVQTRTETRFSDRPVTSRPGSRVQWESETDLRSIGHGADSTLSRRSQIGSGAGQYPQIGSGVGYHQPRIGSGTSLDQRIGSGTSLNQPRIGSGTSLNQPRIGSGAEIDRPRIGSGASYNSPSPNIGYGTSPGYPLRRVGSDFDWEERRFVGPNELTSYERSRSQSPITVDPTRPSYGLRDTDTYTATILRKQWTEDRDQRIQHKDNLGRRRSPSPPSGADATTYPPRIGNATPKATKTSSKTQSVAMTTHLTIEKIFAENILPGKSKNPAYNPLFPRDTNAEDVSREALTARTSNKINIEQELILQLENDIVTHMGLGKINMIVTHLETITTTGVEDIQKAQIDIEECHPGLDPRLGSSSKKPRGNLIEESKIHIELKGLLRLVHIVPYLGLGQERMLRRLMI